MRKPLIYYQFDQYEYYKKHFKKGYFDCTKDGFGKVIKEENNLINYIEELLLKKVDNRIYINRAEEFFELYDTNNCRRTYEEIKAI